MKTNKNQNKFKLTKENLVLNFLKNGGEFNAVDALKCGIKNPYSIIDSLKKKGYDIIFYLKRDNKNPFNKYKKIWILNNLK